MMTYSSDPKILNTKTFSSNIYVQTTTFMQCIRNMWHKNNSHIVRHAAGIYRCDISPFSSVLLQSQIIRSMLSMKPEDRPEASELKNDVEECKRLFMQLKNMKRQSNTVWSLQGSTKIVSVMIRNSSSYPKVRGGPWMHKDVSFDELIFYYHCGVRCGTVLEENWRMQHGLPFLL